MAKLRTRAGRASTGKPVLAGKWLALASTVAMALAGPVAANQPKPAQRPNIVFMMVDNFGYGDLGSYGGGVLRGVPTPNLDRLAQQGLRLTNFNVEPECTPTRSALMTGRMPVRSGTSFVNNRGQRDGLANWEYTIAELLSDSGYRTAIFGKWHLGSEPGRMPTNQGFDVWYGIPRSSNEAAWTIQPGYDPTQARDTAIWEASKGAPPRRVKAYTLETRGMLDSEITERGVAYIKANAKSQQPFFLYMPFTLPHTPTVGSPKYAKPGRSQYQNVLAEIDGNAGAIIDAVREAGIEDNTIVIFTSDNGPETMLGPGTDYGAQSDSGPFRGEFPELARRRHPGADDRALAGPDPAGPGVERDCCDARFLPHFRAVGRGGGQGAAGSGDRFHRPDRLPVRQEREVGARLRDVLPQRRSARDQVAEFQDSFPDQRARPQCRGRARPGGGDGLHQHPDLSLGVRSGERSEGTVEPQHGPHLGGRYHWTHTQAVHR